MSILRFAGKPIRRRSASARLGLCAVAVAALAPLGLGRTARADLIGTSVTGSLVFPGNPAFNFFLPGNGGVPASGYENSPTPGGTGSATVPVSATLVEFGYQDPSNLDMANFGGSSLTISDTASAGNGGGSPAFQMTFTDTSFAGFVVTKASDTFGPAALTYSLVGNQLTISAPAESLSPSATESATFNFLAAGTAAATPLPRSAVAGLSLIGLLGAARLGRRWPKTT